MQRRSPTKHRHDGTSPLPLGMDWSPPPRRLNGRDSVWPHDHRTGWSYCVTIPSWVVLPKSRDSDPVVFYRVQVTVQSPEGIPTTRGVLRRFNDFLKLFSDLKKSFPKKNLPPAPPKGLLRLKSRVLLEERRSSLEEWMTKLLSDIDLSRSVSVAAFFELEAAARSSFRDVSQQSPETSLIGNGASPPQQTPPHPSSSLTAGSSSVTSDYGSDTAYETSELGMMDDSFDFGIEDPTLDEDLTSPIDTLVKYGMSNIDEGLFLGKTILDQLGGIPRHKPHASYVNNGMERDVYRGNSLRTSSVASNDGELFSRSGQEIVHTRKLSNESVGSDESSLRGSEISNSGIPNSSGDGSVDHLAGSELFGNAEIINSAQLQGSGDVQIVLPVDQRHKMNRVLQNMQHRLVSAKTDMEDLISRLNREMAVKDYLATKVKDLEVELEASRQKNKENLQQAIVIEREKLTQMQWDMEELRQKSLEMELKLKSKEDGQPVVNLEVGTSNHEKDEASQELEVARRQLDNLSKQYGELEAKSKADIKFLAKEFKSLKSSHTELKQELDQLKENKTEIGKLLQEEREARNHDKIAREKLIHDCRTLCNQFQACDLVFSHEGDDLSTVHSSLEDTLEALSASENNVNRVLSEFTEENGNTTEPVDEAPTEDDLRMVLAQVFTLNAKLRKQVTSVISHALQKGATIHRDHEEAPIVKINHVENINNSL